MGDRAERARHVGLEDDPELLGLAGLDLAVEVLERRAAAALAALGGDLGLARLDGGAGRLLVGDDAQDVARLGHLGQAEDQGRRRGAGLLDPLAVLVLERADAAERLADDDDVTDVERAGLDERGADRAAAPCPARPRRSCRSRTVRVGLQLLEVGDEQDHVDEVLEPDRLFAETGTRGVSPPYSSMTMPASVSSVLTRSGWSPACRSC